MILQLLCQVKRDLAKEHLLIRCVGATPGDHRLVLAATARTVHLPFYYRRTQWT